VNIQVAEQLSSHSSAHEKAWKDSARAAVAARVEFRVAVSRNANEVWDLDNVIEPALDAMEGIFGPAALEGASAGRRRQGRRLEAVKRLPREEEPTGTTIDAAG
jgi:hypothetical protein